MNKKILLLATEIVLIVSITFLMFSIFLNKSRNDEVINNGNIIKKTEDNFQNTDDRFLKAEEIIVNSHKKNIIDEPINNSLNRISKKPFGIKVSPNNSLVQPERFSGYHAGTDFEIFAGEKNLEVKVSAICTGPLVIKRWVSGYGGVAVQRCEINNETVTVVYGHLKLSSILKSLNENIDQDEKIGILGRAFSSDTDSERKHLHLGIYRGKVVDLRGYVQNQEELEDWVDYASLIK